MSAMVGREVATGPGGTGLSGADLAAIRTEIQQIAAPYDAAHLMAILSVRRNLVTRDWKEVEHGTPLADETVIASLLGRGQIGPTEAKSAGDILAVVDELLDLGAQAATITMYRALDGGLTNDPRKAIASIYRAHDAMVRGDAYERHELPLVRELFNDPATSKRLRDDHGFDVVDALAFEAAVTHVIEVRVNAQQLIRPEALRDRSVVRALSVTPQLLARVANRDEAAARAFLSDFSLSFGHEERGGALLGGNSILRRHPFVRLEQERFLATSGINLMAAIRPRLEAALKSSDAWERYQTHRATTVEKLASRALSDALRPEHVWQNLDYDIAGQTFETDLLIVVDDTLMIVEAKAGGLSEQAARGRPAALAEELTALVGSGAEQAGRLRDAVLSGAPVAFTERATGTPVDVGLERIKRIEPVVVTLAPVGWIQGAADKIAEAGIIPSTTDLPWVVPLQDLRLITELTDFPSQLTRYIALRRKLPANVHSAADEVNVWMLYVLSNIERLPRNVPIMVPNTTQSVDSWVMFGAERPAMQLSDTTRAELERGLGERRPGWLARGEALVAGEQRKRPPVHASVEELARQALPAA